MIQRPQTLMIILGVLLNAAAPFSALADRFYADPHGWWAYAFISALLLAVGTASYAVSLYKDRTAQSVWLRRAIFFQVIALGLASAIVATIGPMSEALLPELIGLAGIAAAFVLFWIARMWVLKDEALVRSIDRIR